MRVHCARSRRAFTLVELMVSLVIAGILIGVIFQFLLGQGRFARLQGAREEVQQNARVALDVISSDLRAVGQQGIISATANSISFRAPRAWGLVCGYISTSPVKLAVLFPLAAMPMLRSGEDELAVATDFYRVTDETGDGSVAANKCKTDVKPNPDPVLQQARVFSGREGTAIPDNFLPRGDSYVYDVVTYDVAESTVAGTNVGRWIRRNGQPLAGPLPAGGGLTFAYTDQNGAPTADASGIRRIRITVTTHSRARFKDQAQADTDSTIIYLRNR